MTSGLERRIAEGDVVGVRYRLLSKLGQGGMGSVWLAEDAELLRHVALKLIDPAIADSPDALARFRREARMAASLRTQHVAHVLDYGVADGLPFTVMEVLEGEDLSQRLDRVRRLAANEWLTIARQVCRAVSEAHHRGIVHRDLKPGNVFLARDVDSGGEIVKVLDFGIAKALRPMGEALSLETGTGQLLGTPFYMSPEQLTQRQAVDHRADIWSLGVITFEVLTGRRPFEAGTLADLVLAICSDPLPRPSAIASVPPEFDAWFARAVHRSPDLRFQSVETALEALERIGEGATDSGCGARHLPRAATTGVGESAQSGAEASIALEAASNRAAVELQGMAPNAGTDGASAISVVHSRNDRRPPRRRMIATAVLGVACVGVAAGVWSSWAPRGPAVPSVAPANQERAETPFRRAVLPQVGSEPPQASAGDARSRGSRGAPSNPRPVQSSAEAQPPPAREGPSERRALPRAPATAAPHSTPAAPSSSNRPRASMPSASRSRPDSSATGANSGKQDSRRRVLLEEILEEAP